MSKWLKNKLEKFAAKLNNDDASEAMNDDSESSPSFAAQKKAVYQPQNIEELKEVSIGAIGNAIKMLGYGKSKISGLIFHTNYADNAVENVGLQALLKDPEFIKQIKRTFKSKGIAYKDDLLINIIHQSSSTNKVTQIAAGIGVEVLTPTETLRKIKARMVAAEGITWESEYILDQTDKTYFIGRCKNPKIENGPKIHNDIAFIGCEEMDEEKYKINNYISRSHATVIFDKELGAYKIYRSKFLNNPSHKIKIYNTSLGDFSGVSLNHSAVPHVLRNGDSICFNDKIVLEFYIVDQFNVSG